ncbi:MAG TPA: DUF5666 domain-containing protein [Gaiellaceae bacterium]|nr:DUF5666 domain-containing protein [Gaiellaceae bacterium]
MVRLVVAALAAFLLIPAVASAASPVQGSVSGPVVSVSGSTFTITTKLSPTGKSKVSAGSATITEQATAPKSDLKIGACVMANGSKNSKGVVTALRITVSQPVKGSCTNGFARFGGGGRSGGVRPNRPAGGTPPAGGFSRSGNFGFAFGSVTKLSGSTLTVKGTDFLTKKTTLTTVSLTSKTTLSETETVKVSDVKTKQCAFVFGSSTDKGVTVKATRVQLSPEQNGTCTAGFRRPGS